MRLITMEQLCDKLSCTRSTVYKIMELGSLPLPVKLPTGGNRWVEEDVDAAMRTFSTPLEDNDRTLVLSVHDDGEVTAEIVNDSGSDYVGSFSGLDDALTAGQAQAMRIYGETFRVAVLRGED